MPPPLDTSITRFIGRQVEIRELVGLIATHGESAAVVGEPRVGKTSLLEHLRSPATETLLKKTSSRELVFASVDAHMLADRFTSTRFWTYIFEPLAAANLFAGPALGTSYR